MGIRNMRGRETCKRLDRYQINWEGYLKFNALNFFYGLRISYKPIICFDKICPPSPFLSNPSHIYPHHYFSLNFTHTWFTKTHWVELVLSVYAWMCRTTDWHMGSLSLPTSLKKTDSSSLRSHQQLAASWLGAGLHEPSPFILPFWLAWSWADLMHSEFTL